MKKLFYLVLLMFFISCTNDIKPIENSKQITTVQIQENVVDTMAMSISNDNKTIHLLNVEDNIVVYKLKQVNPEYVEVHAVALLLMIVIIIMLVVIVSSAEY